MVTHKFDWQTARKPVKLIRSAQGDTYNMRVLMARGIRHEVAQKVVEDIRSGMVSAPDTYAWTIAQNPKNLDPEYIARQERMAKRAEKIQLSTPPDPALKGYAQSENDALEALPDLIRDDEVRLPKPKKRRKRQPKQSKRSGPKVYATPARDRAAREAMKELRANQ